MQPILNTFSAVSLIMARNPSIVAMRRLQSEMREWHRCPPEGCRLLSSEPLTEWVVEMEGPEAAAPGLPRLYKGEVYRLRIRFSDNYPLDPPEFVFLPPSPEHLHIYTNGFICLDILYSGGGGGWSPAMTMQSCCLSLRSMLASATSKQRPPGDAQMSMRGYRSPKDIGWMFDDATV